MAPAFIDNETSNKVVCQVNSVRLPHQVPHKYLVVSFEKEDADKILKESLAYAGANPELKPNFLKRLICAFTWKKKSSEDDSNSQKGDQKQVIKVEASETNEGESVPSMSKKESTGKEINVEVSETNEGESVPNMAEEKSNGKEIEKGSENCTNGAKKDNQSKENDGKDVKAEEKPSVGVDKNGAKAAPERKSVIETYKNTKDVRCEDPRRNFERSCTMHISSRLGTESSCTEYEKPGEAQKARAAEVQTKSELLVKNDTTTLEPVSDEVKKEYWSKQVQGGQGRFHDKGQRGGKYNRNGRGRY